MIVKMNMQVSSQDFYDYLIHSILLDVLKNEEKILEEQDIVEGFSYLKKIRNHDPVKVEVIDIQKPILYTSCITYGTSENHIAYQIRKLDDKRIEVEYKEEYKSSKKLEQWNFYLLNFLFSKRNKKKMTKMLRAMENYIQMKEEQDG